MDKTNSYFFIAIIVPLLALISPLILIPAEKFFPYPYILEEVVKVIFVLLVLKLPGKAFQTKLAIFFGLLFALSESAFYLPNFSSAAVISLFSQRFFTTAILHILTTLIILVFAQKKRLWIILGLLLAIALHYFYNQSVALLFN